MRWTVSVPVWGEWHMNVYLRYVIWRHVLMGLEGCRYIVHTDDWNRVNESPAMRRLKKFCEVEYRALPPNLRDYELMNACHLDAMKDSEAVLFLLPDLIFNVEAFDFVKNCGKKLVVVAGMRTLSEDPSGIPMHARELSSWGVAHLHPNYKDSFWGSREGYSIFPSNVYFRGSHGVWVHGFHLHPIAAVLEEKNHKCENTFDADFVDTYDPQDAYVVANREIALVEITHKDKFNGSNTYDISTPQAIAKAMRKAVLPIHEHFWTHRIALDGDPDRFAEHVPMAVLDQLRHAA